MIKAGAKKMGETKEEREGEISTRTQGNKERKPVLSSLRKSLEEQAVRKMLLVLRTKIVVFLKTQAFTRK